MGPNAVTNSALPTCKYCNAYHTGVCPRIEEIEYHPNGSVKRVRLRPMVSVGAGTCPNQGRPCFCTGACRGESSTSKVYGRTEI